MLGGANASDKKIPLTLPSGKEPQKLATNDCTARLGGKTSFFHNQHYVSETSLQTMKDW
jgi:hypothetical protein